MGLVPVRQLRVLLITPPESQCVKLECTLGHGEFPVDFAPLRSGGSFLLPEFLAGIGQFHFHDLVLFELGLVKLLLTDTPWRLGRSREFLTGEKNHWNPNFSPMRKLAKELVVCQNYTNVSKIANTLL